MNKKDSQLTRLGLDGAGAQRAPAAKTPPSRADPALPEHVLQIARASAGRMAKKGPLPMTAEQIKAVFGKL